MSKERGNTLIANNKKAYHEYLIEEKFEAGIELVGTEVKSIRQGNCSIKEAIDGKDPGASGQRPGRGAVQDPDHAPFPRRPRGGAGRGIFSGQRGLRRQKRHGGGQK